LDFVKKFFPYKISYNRLGNISLFLNNRLKLSWVLREIKILYDMNFHIYSQIVQKSIQKAFVSFIDYFSLISYTLSSFWPYIWHKRRVFAAAFPFSFSLQFKRGLPFLVALSFQLKSVPHFSHFYLNFFRYFLSSYEKTSKCLQCKSRHTFWKNKTEFNL